VGGYHAAKPKLAQDLIETRSTADGLVRWLDTWNWMRLLNVRYIVVDAMLDSPGLREVHRGQRFIIYENPAALARATVVGAYRVAATDSAILDSVGRGTPDPARATWLLEDPQLTLGPVEGASAQITRYDLNHVEVDVQTPGPGLLRLADLYYPDWEARVDGRPARLLRADYLLRAVPVPAGRHRVSFTFRSPAVAQGLTLTLISLALVLVLLGVGWWQSRRRASAVPAAGAA
jgi:hypothetical protein